MTLSDQNYSISPDKVNHLAAVGSVAAHWAMMEMFIDTYALQLAGLGDGKIELLEPPENWTLISRWPSLWERRKQ
jgi:hypothetical protein